MIDVIYLFIIKCLKFRFLFYVYLVDLYNGILIVSVIGSFVLVMFEI